MTGTISDLDSDGLFGLIEADEDGHLVLFNLRGTDFPVRARLKVGTRVEFVQEPGEWAPRARSMSPLLAN